MRAQPYNTNRAQTDWHFANPVLSHSQWGKILPVFNDTLCARYLLEMTIRDSLFSAIVSELPVTRPQQAR